MELTLSTHLLSYRALHDDILAAVAARGVGAVEAWLAEPHVPWRDLDAVAALRERLAGHGLRARTVHLPFYPSIPELLDHGRRWSLLDAEPARRREARAGAAAGLRAAAALGAEAAVLHLGWPGDAWDAEQTARARAAVAELLETARRAGVRLLLENILSAGTRCARLVALLDELDPTGDAGICLDLGHAHVEGEGAAGLLAQIEDALPRLAHVHVHDNDGRADQHLAPGQGAIPWRPVLERLRAAGYRGTGALEIRDRSRGAEDAGVLLARELGLVETFTDTWRGEGLLR